jgi:lysophospholipase
VTAEDGRKLRAALFASADPRGSIVLSPGRTEPIEKYFEIIDEFRARGFTVLAHDWRGQGLSDRLHRDRLRGHAEGVDPFLDDLSAVLKTFEPRLPRPWIGFGHSMGGGLMVLALLRGERRFAGAMLTAPMLGLQLAGRSTGLVAGLARSAKRLGLGAQMIPGRPDPVDLPLAANMLTHDQARWERFVRQLRACPDLRLGGATWSWVEFALDLSAEIARPGRAEAVETPILALTAGEEFLVDNAATEAFVKRAPKAELVRIAGARHELLMETDALRAKVWAAFDEWVGRVV